MFFRKQREKERNAEINKAFLEGYRKGVRNGRSEVIFKNMTPNEIREYLGLEPIKKN